MTCSKPIPSRVSLQHRQSWQQEPESTNWVKLTTKHRHCFQYIRVFFSFASWEHDENIDFYLMFLVFISSGDKQGEGVGEFVIDYLKVGNSWNSDIILVIRIKMHVWVIFRLQIESPIHSEEDFISANMFITWNDSAMNFWQNFFFQILSF